MNRLDYLKTIGRGELSIGRLRDAAFRRLTDIPHRIAWEMPTQEQKQNRLALEDCRDRHKGKRCFVVANGPSLGRMDLSPLAAELSIGMNRIYRLGHFVPTYLTIIDVDVQLEQMAHELWDVACPKFINWNARALVRGMPDVAFLKLTFRPRFSRDLRQGIWGGHSVTYACLQLAYWMGFVEVVLIGKDHDYQQRGVPGELVVASGSEKDHAVKGYYKSGQPWRIPDYKGEELAYRAARETFERDGRRILDATVGGKLTVFPKVDYEKVL